MKVIIDKSIQEEIEVGSIHLSLPVFYEEEDMPSDFPFRNGETWAISFTPEGQIIGWTQEHEEWFVKNQGHEFVEGLVFNLYMKVCDGGCYEVRGPGGEVLLAIKDGYVPHDLIPGAYGDYVELDISSTGEILNLDFDFEHLFRKEGR